MMKSLFNRKEEHDACGVGFVVHTMGKRSNDVLFKSRVMLERMAHRGACACDETTGDGAGVMTGIPVELYSQFARQVNVELPDLGKFAVGVLFINKENNVVSTVVEEFRKLAEQHSLTILFWRMADVNDQAIGAVARSKEPGIVQVFVVRDEQNSLTGKRGEGEFMPFRSQIYLLRKYASHRLKEMCYLCSLSAETVVYKGMFTSKQLWNYYADLGNPAYLTHFALVHNRFSTNTLPSWCRAHPQRLLAHNGEINTLRGNVNYCNSRQSLMQSLRFPKDDLTKLFPIIEPEMSDSGCLDNLMEFLSHAGDYTLPEAVMMMIPEAWHNFHPGPDTMPQVMFDFYRWAANSLEPWDGPALVAFSDGRYVGAVLDRNGLRPARYCVTSDGLVCMSSEVGVVDIADDVTVLRKGRLKAGRLLIVDTQQGGLLDDRLLKETIASKQPYGQWLDQGAVSLSELHTLVSSVEGDNNVQCAEDDAPVFSDRRLPLFGFNPENINLLLLPLLKTGKEALGSMGNDAPLACLSQYNPHVFDYFKQLFAQVTNPPIDPFRERIVMTLMCPVGPQSNILIPSARQTERLWLSGPLLSLADLGLLKSLDGQLPRRLQECIGTATGAGASLYRRKSASNVLGWRSHVLDATFPVPSREDATGLAIGSLLMASLERLCASAERAIVRDGVHLLIVSDRASGPERLPVPSLLALGAVHQHLLRRQLRMRVALVVESGEIKEVHHFCTLIGFGADAICPYLLFDFIARMHVAGMLGKDQSDHSLDDIYANLNAAVEMGIFKVIAKMGIATVHSYKSAQVFEAVGLAQSVVEKCFTGTASRIGGADFEVIARETYARHSLAYPETINVPGHLASMFDYNPGFYHWRPGGESHINDPKALANLQAASRNNSREEYRRFVEATDENNRQCTLRGQFELRFADRPTPLEKVEPATEIVKRFSTGAMSLGSISAEAHSTLAIAMNRIGARSNTGEGGEHPDRYRNPEISSSIKQVASARFGVNSAYLAHADVLQIKMAQGAKPGEGGELPAHKVTEEIAVIRFSVPGIGLISPPPHHDIYSIEDLAQLIYDLKAANPFATISVKLVSEVGVGVIAAGVAKARAVHITVSGHDGGTGASSWTGIKHAGLPWELGIAETNQSLVEQCIRSRVTLQVDGQIRTGRDVVIAALLGADEFSMSTAPLIVLGCTMMRKCHLNTCPVGIATQDPVLRAKFTGQPEHIINYLFLLAEEVRDYLSRLGVCRLDEIIGNTDLLKSVDPPTSPKAQLLDLGSLLYRSKPAESVANGGESQGGQESRQLQRRPSEQAKSPPAPKDSGDQLVEAVLRQLPADRRLDRAALWAARRLIEHNPDDLSFRETVTLEAEICNGDRAAFSTLSYAVSRRFADKGLPSGRHIKIQLKGVAGQSFCAFLARGISVRLEGDANDYVAKGLSGGSLTIVPQSRLLEQGFRSEANLIVGNVCLYGATDGRVFLRGQAAERFCVRNCGALVVCEGVGDHGCEYMTGGRVVILGDTGRNFAAGMSGGLAFVYDPADRFPPRCNLELVELEQLHARHEFSDWLRSTIVAFTEETGSTIGARLLDDWSGSVGHFCLVSPRDYRRALEARQTAGRELRQTATAAVSKTVDIEDLRGSTYNGLEDAPLDKLRGFVKYPRNKQYYRPAALRMQDWNEVHAHAEVAKDLRRQTARCMDCGVPFCQSYAGCPLGNLIPNWNDLVFKGDWRQAHLALMQTNNFPEFTGRVCPAPCEGACVLGINSDPVTIKAVECTISDVAWQRGWMSVREPVPSTGRRIVVVGSGPAGLACADQLNAAGHTVVVLERRDRPGGLLRYGIPTMKLDRKVLDRRLYLMRANGVEFKVNTRVTCDPAVFGDVTRGDLNAVNGQSVNEYRAEQLVRDFDAVVLCLGSTWPRDLGIPGRHLSGIHFAMSFLETWQRQQEHHRQQQHRRDAGGDQQENSSDLFRLANGKRVIVLGGGDTGVDCLATSLRQGVKSIQTLEILPSPPERRDAKVNPWPDWPLVWRTEYGHEEVTLHSGRDPRTFNILTKEFVDNGQGAVGALRTVKVDWSKCPTTGRWLMQEVPGTEETLPCDLVLLALGFQGPEDQLIKALALSTTPQSTIGTVAPGSYATGVPGVYAAGDCRRGQSLVVHAINEGRQAARQVDRDLTGDSRLPGPGGLVTSSGAVAAKAGQQKHVVRSRNKLEAASAAVIA